ncbi:MAG: hypothetical protein GY910_20605 [bacterium]|nr:hypothetical protein [Deltaproteobacteria bacterium]MCP4907385.1 hypothetical protein [bacterium]
MASRKKQTSEAAVREIDFFDPGDEDHEPAETFIGCPIEQRITGTAGSVEVFLGVPEHGSPELIIPPDTALDTVEMLARIGTGVYFDFDPAPGVFAA